MYENSEAISWLKDSYRGSWGKKYYCQMITPRIGNSWFKNKYDLPP